MTRPRLLDLYCCEGGAGAGYARAGFDVDGVDLLPRYAKRYPFRFHAGDAVRFVREFGHLYDVIHASPPCNLYSITNAARQHDYPDLVGPTRDALIATGKPYVIENVIGAPLLDPLILCGSQFGLTAVDDDGELLRLERHRQFESNVDLVAPETPHSHDRSVRVAGAYGGARRTKAGAKERKGGYVPSKPVIERLLGIDWMTEAGLFQSIPPVYTEHIGRQLLAAIA